MNNDIAMSFYKRYFPTISIRKNDKWQTFSEKEIIDILMAKNKISDYELEYSCNYNKEKKRFEVSDYNFNIISNITIQGIDFDKIDYNYFDLWNISFPDGREYHVIIGQGLGHGFEDTYLTKCIMKNINMNNGNFYLGAKSPDEFQYQIKKAITRDEKASKKYWIKDSFKTSFNQLIRFKFNNAFWHLKDGIEKIKELKYCGIE